MHLRLARGNSTRCLFAEEFIWRGSDRNDVVIMVMSDVKGSLDDVIRGKCTDVPLGGNMCVCVCVCCEMLLAVLEMHRTVGVSHFDSRPSIVLYSRERSGNLEAKLNDFGAAKPVQQPLRRFSGLSTTRAVYFSSRSAEVRKKLAHPFIRATTLICGKWGVAPA